jgi:lysophospholipase L1-like esterase
MRAAAAALALCLTAAACSDPSPVPSGAVDLSGLDAGSGAVTSPPSQDAGPTSDAAPELDTGGTTGAGPDAGQPEAGALPDAGDPGPCPAPPEACRVMPLGDSITFGVGSTLGGGYRVPLFAAAVAGGLHLTFVGSQANGPTVVAGEPFPRSHDGYSGYTIEDGGGHRGLSPLAWSLVSAARPHVVLLMIGVNDVGLALGTGPEIAARLGNMLETVFMAAPGATVLVAQITPNTITAETPLLDAYNLAMLDVAAQQVGEGHHVQVVDVHGAFAARADWPSLLSDGVHPNDAGYVVMGDAWFGALAPLLR